MRGLPGRVTRLDEGSVQMRSKLQLEREMRSKMKMDEREETNAMNGMRRTLARRGRASEGSDWEIALSRRDRGTPRPVTVYGMSLNEKL